MFEDWKPFIFFFSVGGQGGIFMRHESPFWFEAAMPPISHECVTKRCPECFFSRHQVELRDEYPWLEVSLSQVHLVWDAVRVASFFMPLDQRKLIVKVACGHLARLQLMHQSNEGLWMAMKSQMHTAGQ